MSNIGNMYGPDFTFLGIPRCDLDKPESYKDADVIIVGAPIDSGTSHRSVRRWDHKQFEWVITYPMMHPGHTLQCELIHFKS